MFSRQLMQLLQHNRKKTFNTFTSHPPPQKKLKLQVECHTSNTNCFVQICELSSKCTSLIKCVSLYIIHTHICLGTELQTYKPHKLTTCLLCEWRVPSQNYALCLMGLWKVLPAHIHSDPLLC